MMSQRIAVAAFVKTPGLSPIKTRLAAGIGAKRTAEFYALALDAIEQTLSDASRSRAPSGTSPTPTPPPALHPYWAIAEPSALAHPRWQQFARIYQGPGDLADRLGRVFDELRQRYDAVIALGADSPQITPHIVRIAAELVATECDAHVLGRCHDGGFYLVGTSAALPAEIWQDLPYSTPDAADAIAARLAARGTLHELPPLTDVDEPGDLAILHRELSAVAVPTPQQLALMTFLQEIDNLNSRGATHCRSGPGDA